MGGAISRYCRLLFAVVLLVVTAAGVGSVTAPRTVLAISPLDSFTDIINNTLPAADNVQHDISFILPPDAEQVTPSDWILINLPNYSQITVPYQLVGSYGNPIMTVVGTTLEITNIALLPGTRFELLGTTAENPKSQSGFEVIASIATGSATGLIRNQSTTVAGPGNSFISVSATVDSPLASLNLAGFTSPSAFVTLTESGAVIGTTSATGDGSFSFPLSGVDPGNHTYGISATDVNNLATAQVQEQLYLLANTATSVTNILLSPTIQLDKATIQPGDTLTISGSARPLSQMSIFTESPLKSYSASTDIQGNWSYTLPSSETQNYAPGQYRAYAIVTDSNGNQSLTSPSVNFLVEQSTSGNNPAPSCDISHGDLNCDGTVNLTDFSILLYWWGTDHKAADINGDGIVNLVDFSIMMYYFQR